MGQRNYRNKAMAREEGFAHPPYSNLIEYKHFKERGAHILDIPEENLQSEADEEE